MNLYTFIFHAQNNLNMLVSSKTNDFVTYSCTSSSCEYWPHCGPNPNKYPSFDDKNHINGGLHYKINDSDSSGNNDKVSVNTQEQAHSGTTVTINGGQMTMLQHVNHSINSSITFLGNCEMPITKSVTRKNSGNDNSAHKIDDKKVEENFKKKIPVNSPASREVKYQLVVSSQKTG